MFLNNYQSDIWWRSDSGSPRGWEVYRSRPSQCHWKACDYVITLLRCSIGVKSLLFSVSYFCCGIIDAAPPVFFTTRYLQLMQNIFPWGPTYLSGVDMGLSKSQASLPRPLVGGDSQNSVWGDSTSTKRWWSRLRSRKTAAQIQTIMRSPSRCNWLHSNGGSLIPGRLSESAWPYRTTDAAAW